MMLGEKVLPSQLSTYPVSPVGLHTGPEKNLHSTEIKYKYKIFSLNL